MKLRNSRHHSVVWCKAYFDILNRLGVTHDSRVRKTDEQSDGQTFS